MAELRAAGTQFGQLSVGGQATRSGTLQVKYGRRGYPRARASVPRLGLPLARRHLRHPLRPPHPHRRLRCHGRQGGLPV